MAQSSFLNLVYSYKPQGVVTPIRTVLTAKTEWSTGQGVKDNFYSLIAIAVKRSRAVLQM